GDRGSRRLFERDLRTLRLSLRSRGQVSRFELRTEASRYQTRQTFSGGLTMGWPALQAKALANSGMLITTPLMRYCAGECGSTCARMRISSGRSLAQSHWA